jgi:hypothetical protein
MSNYLDEIIRTFVTPKDFTMPGRTGSPPPQPAPQQGGGMMPGMVVHGGDPQNLAQMQQALQQNQGGGLLGGLAGAKGDLLGAAAAYKNTQQTRLPGVAGGLEGLWDAFREPTKRKEMVEAQKAADAAELLKKQGEREAAIKARAAALANIGNTPEEAIRIAAGTIDSEKFALKDFDQRLKQTDAQKQASKRQERAEWLNTPEGQAFRARQGNEAADFYLTFDEQPSKANVHTYSPSLGKDMMWVDPNNFEKGVKPIPGSETERDWNDAKSKAANRKINVARTTTNAMDQIDRAIELTGWTTAGLAGALDWVPGLPAKELANALTTVKSNISFDRLETMRNNSPTGGALGNVSNFEVEMLGSNTAPLDQKMAPEALLESLADVKRSYDRIAFVNENQEQLMSLPEDQVIAILDEQFGKYSPERVATVREKLERYQKPGSLSSNDGWKIEQVQ